MDFQWVTGMSLIKEILSILNRGGNTQGEEDRLRRIIRDVMSETSNSSGSEKEMLERMMRLMEHNAARHTSELQATAQERDHYRTKMDELNRQMEQLMRDSGAPPSGGADPGLTQKQKRLAEMWEELKSMRQNKQWDETQQGRPFNKGGRRGGSGASDGKPRYQSQNQGAFSQFGKENKDGTPFSAGKHYSQGRDSEKPETNYFEDYKRGSFPSKSFYQGNTYEESPPPFSEKFPQHGGTDRRHGGWNQYRGQSYNRGQHNQTRDQFHRHHEQSQDGQGQSNQNLGAHGGSYQHRGQSYDRGQHQPRGQFQQRREQSQDGQGRRSNQNFGGHGGSYQHRGQSYNRGQHQSRGQFRQHHEQSQDGQGQSHFTPEEIEALRSVLKQRVAAAERTELSDDSGSDVEDALKSSNEGKSTSGDAGETVPDAATNAKPVVDSKKKKNKRKKKTSKKESSEDQAAAEQKPKCLSPLEVFTASGFDMSQISGLNMDDIVSDMMLVTKEDGNIVSCQPGTVRELVEFKQKYPNAQAIIVKTSESN